MFSIADDYGPMPPGDVIVKHRTRGGRGYVAQLRETRLPGRKRRRTVPYVRRRLAGNTYRRRHYARYAGHRAAAR